MLFHVPSIVFLFFKNLILQMALSTRFQSGTVVCLEINTPYTMTHAERIFSESGRTVLVTL